MPVASGVVNRFDSVMTSLCGFPLAVLTSRKPSPPAPPALLMTTIDCFIRPCLEMMPCTVRAIWSAPPPGPAGTMISTVRVGSHASWAVVYAAPHSTNAAPVAPVFSNLVAFPSLAGPIADLAEPVVVVWPHAHQHRGRRFYPLIRAI